jgi:hypothetical protein
MFSHMQKVICIDVLMIERQPGCFISNGYDKTAHMLRRHYPYCISPLPASNIDAYIIIGYLNQTQPSYPGLAAPLHQS